MNQELTDVDMLRARCAELVAMLEEIKKAHEKLLFEHELLKRQVFGPKAERVRNEGAQLPLLDVLAALGRLPAVDEGVPGDSQGEQRDDEEQGAGGGAGTSPPPPKRRPQPHGRRKLELEDLPFRRLVLVPPERLAPGGDRLIKIGEEVTHLIERQPASMVRLEIVREKFKAPELAEPTPQPDSTTVASEPDAAQATSTVTVGPTKLPPPLGAAPVPGRIYVADMPERVIPRAMAEPGFLAHILVSKYGDHIPLHRQEAIYKREGFKVARSTLGEWVEESTRLLGHIVDAMWKDAKANASYSIVDATGVLVQEKEECKRAHFYVVVVPQEHVLFRFTRTNDGPSVAALLAGFSGYVHADAATVYHELYRQELGHLIEVGCWAHARRKFFEALSRDRERALMGIGFISQLYDAHRAALGEGNVADTTKRAALARPILARLFRWARREFRFVKEGTPIHVALGYLVRQRRALLRFLHDGRIRLDTNPAELELRREVVGRKNWLFVGSDNGARWNTIAVSLIASCQMHGIEPWSYLRDVLTLLPSWPEQRALELAPKSWQATSALPEVQERIAELRLVDRAVPVDPIAAVAAAIA